MNTNEYQKILISALEELNHAADLLMKHTAPITPLPQHRIFKIYAGITYPNLDPNGLPLYKEIRPTRDKYATNLGYYSVRIADEILAVCKHQPRLILRALRRIQAATAWCEARAEGRKRMAEEILRQQANAVEALNAEAAMLALK